mmetsp:Transcript_1690/g.4374  ORF Transcript_1690/g.4374 Transcript_1690/m.4374 type:complete len:107 (+) Transcript_1690:227-547(+)
MYSMLTLDLEKSSRYGTRSVRFGTTSRVFFSFSRHEMVGRNIGLRANGVCVASIIQRYNRRWLGLLREGRKFIRSGESAPLSTTDENETPPAYRETCRRATRTTTR